MDPTEALAQILRGFALWRKNQKEGYGLIWHEEQARIADHMDDLRYWLRNGGFPPDPAEAIRRACLDDIGI